MLKSEHAFAKSLLRMDGFGERQRSLLSLLLGHKPGLTIDALAEQLKITRTAVKQHLVALEAAGFVKRGMLQPTAGRPGQVYQLTEKGNGLFPKQYSWFSEVLIQAMRKEKGPDGLRAWLAGLGRSVAAVFVLQMKEQKTNERILKTAELMNELAYHAKAKKTELPHTNPVIEATNCVYHSLAKKFPEVCEFDLAFLKELTESQVHHEECIAKGGNVCRFSFPRS